LILNNDEGFKIMRRLLKLEKGITLLEILLVILLLSGAGFFLLVKIPSDIQIQKLDLSSTELMEEIKVIQQAALSEDVWYQIKFYPDAELYKIFRQGKFLRSIELKEGVEFINRPSELTILPTGAPAQGLTIMLSAGKNKKSIIIASVMGRIREE